MSDEEKRSVVLENTRDRLEAPDLPDATHTAETDRSVLADHDDARLRSSGVRYVESLVSRREATDQSRSGADDVRRAGTRWGPFDVEIKL
jgi:hypothetical protein